MASIKDRLAQLRAQHRQSAPSFLPSRKVKPVIVLPDAAELVTDTHDLETLRELVALHVQYGAEERKARAMKTPVAESIKSICEDYSLTKLTCDHNKVSRYKTIRRTIVGSLLTDAGVSPAVVKACTVETESWGVRVTPPSGSDDDENDQEAD